MRTVRWNELACRDYFENIDFLLLNWSDKEAQKFIDKVYEIENLLAKGNVEFQNTNRADIKRCVINKQISLFYRAVDTGIIEFLRFWNNNQDVRYMHL
jgi:hypothetical protein